jgi:ferredoxin
VIFPQNETFFSFVYKKDNENFQKTDIELSPKLDVHETIIFGARPCDAKGFRIYDRVYLDTDTPDPYYKERRDKTTIITMCCPSPSPGCFCVAVGGSPSNTEGSDAMITEMEHGYFIEPLTQKGMAILEEPLIEDGNSYKSEAKKQQDAAYEKVKNPFTREGSLKVSLALFNLDAFWEQVTARCISCGVCTFLCPTCYCFNITDEQASNGGERIRSWDACMFSHFTLEASGHNPRPFKHQRFRNRVGHKFLYYPDKYDGIIACCGCGRCIRYCPVSIDISEVVAHLYEGRQDLQTKPLKDEKKRVK